MTTYEQLDWIADCVIPVLGVLALLLPALPQFRASIPAWKRILCAALSVALAYAGMFLDMRTGAWSVLSLDYSTHSAVTVALLIPLGHLSRRWRMAAVSIGLSYAALMIYQRYHTTADILTTAIPIGLASWLICHGMLSPSKLDQAAVTRPMD